MKMLYWTDYKKDKELRGMSREQVQRIKDMEAALDISKAAVDKLSEAMDAFEAVQDRYNALLDYYSNGQWRADFEADEEGLLPDDLKRGVLSEDAVYDLITEHRELVNRMCAIVTEAEKSHVTDAEE